MHLSENEGTEGKAFVVTGGLGFVGSAVCLELVRRGARLVRAFDLRSTSPWSDLLLRNGVHCLKGSPVNTFEFLRPLLKSLEYDIPKATLPVGKALLAGKAFSVIYTLMYPWLNTRWLPQPLLLPAEVYKVGVTHYFSYLKAKQELGYTPITSPQQGMAATISFFQERKQKSLDGPTIYEWFFCVFGMSAVIIAAAFPVPLLRSGCLMVLRSMWVLRLLAIWAVAMHVGESVYAWRLAKRVDPQNARGWFWQTFVLGIFSLKFLLKRAKNK